MAAASEGVEDALWNAIRSIEEKILLMKHLAEHVRKTDDGAAAEQFKKRAQEAERQANLVRRAVLHVDEPTGKSGMPEAPEQPQM